MCWKTAIANILIVRKSWQTILFLKLNLTMHPNYKEILVLMAINILYFCIAAIALPKKSEEKKKKKSYEKTTLQCQ